MKQKIIRRIVQVLVTTLIQVLLLFLAAGDMSWFWGGAFVGIYFFGILINAVVLFLINPEVIAERADSSGAKSRDQIWGRLAFGMIMLGLPLLLGSGGAYIAAWLAIEFVFIRTKLEDQTLQAELPGYMELVRQPRVRLLPGIW